MTFTEAAVEVLRLVGRPLHYKKITEIAIAKNLLSHVGKAPDMTMSARLATMVKKDRGDEPIIKVKPGVFALRDFDKETLALAETDFDVDVDALPDVEIPRETADPEDLVERPKLPGSDVFPEEEDDDEPILAGMDEEAPTGNGGGEGGSDESGGKRGRRRRKRRGRGEEGRDEPRRDEPRRDEPRRDEPRRERDREHRRDRDRRDDRRGPPRPRERERIDMSRAPEEGDTLGRDLADAIHAALSSQPRAAMSYARAAELLIARGRLAGSAAALASTVAAAVRADGLRRGASGARFRDVEGELALTEWYLPRDASRLEQEARALAERQRVSVRRAFLRKLGELPAAGFAELVATWLNAEGISGLRAVRRPGSSGTELHLAGIMRRGHEEVHVAILVSRAGEDIGGERVVEVRGALHHYGSASAAWIVTTGRVHRSARDEVKVGGAAPCVLLDGDALAEAMEAREVGLVPAALPLCAIDLGLLDALRGGPERLEVDEGDAEDDERGRGKKRRRRGKKRREDFGEPEGAGRDEDRDEDADEGGEGDEGDEGEDSGAEGAPEGSDERPTDAEEAEEEGEGGRRRRRRRGGRRRRRDQPEEGAEIAAQGASEGASVEIDIDEDLDEDLDEDASAGAEGAHAERAGEDLDADDDEDLDADDEDADLDEERREDREESDERAGRLEDDLDDEDEDDDDELGQDDDDLDGEDDETDGDDDELDGDDERARDDEDLDEDEAEPEAEPEAEEPEAPRPRRRRGPRSGGGATTG